MSQMKSPGNISLQNQEGIKILHFHIIFMTIKHIFPCLSGQGIFYLFFTLKNIYIILYFEYTPLKV